jgi:murein L,D-transpeptidase YcbB/YkuD
MRAIALGLIIAASLSPPGLAAEPDGPATLITQKEAVRLTIQGRLSAKSASRKSEQLALVDYYSVPDQNLLWVDENGLVERGKVVMAEIGKADDYGLRASDYTLPKDEGFNAVDAKATDWLADAEIKISYAVLDYANDARGGRIDPQRLSKNLDPSLALPDPAEVMGSIAIRSDPAAYLRSFQPDQPQFEALRQKLIEIRGGGKPTEPAKPGVVTIPDGPVLKLGVQNEQVALLRKRLEVPSQAGANETMFDRDVLEAVKRFQYEHGTTPDGLVGAGTRRMLNNPSEPRQAGGSANVNALLINMERWRWLPHDMGPYYVTVNIPEFMLRVVEDGKTLHTTRIVAGKPDKQTPVFSDEMEEIVFNPYWNVPNSIKTEEIAPYLYQGGGFFGGGWDTSVLARHNLRIRGASGREIDPDTIDWGRVDIRNYELYQPPGPGNVLGTVKFVFPNKHDVYMHDTTQKNLFAQSVRAESHGCMRVQNPDQLAHLLLKHDQGWSMAQVVSATDQSEDNHIALKQKIPVYITYFTLKVNDDGTISTFRDIYGHDARMAAALNGQGMAYDPPAQDSEVVSGQWNPPPQQRGKRTTRQRNELSNDFTRALFGF